MVGWMYCVVDTNYTKPALTDIFSLLIPQAFGFPTISQKSGEKLVRFPNPLASQSQAGTLSSPDPPRPVKITKNL